MNTSSAVDLRLLCGLAMLRGPLAVLVNVGPSSGGGDVPKYPTDLNVMQQWPCSATTSGG